MGYYKLSPARYVTKFWHYYSKMVDVFVCFGTFKSVYLSFLALLGKQQSFGFQDIAINAIRYERYVTKIGAMRYASPEKFYF